MTRPLRLFFLLLLFVCPAYAQIQETYLDINVVPDHPGWTYKVGEPAKFNVTVLRAGYPLEGVEVRYEVGPDMMKPTTQGPLQLREGKAVIDGGTMREPGFLRATVVATFNGKEYRGFGTAGYAPEAIKPTAELPSDFMEFWHDAIQKARTTPLQPTMTLIPEQSNADVLVYHVSFQVDRPGNRYFGMLAVPAKPGKYPAVLQVPGAGIRPYSANTEAARRGVIHLSVGIHGIPVNMDPSVYYLLASGALSNYWNNGLDDRDTYYYKRVILGVIRAGDFLTALPQYDGEHYGVYGGSQGGALSIITAALDERIDALSAMYPAMADHSGYLHGRAGGWPHLFAERNREFREDADKVVTARYYDVVNFARQVRVPGFYTWGYNDTTCPPTSMYSVYNVITAPRDLLLVPETGHWNYPEQSERAFTSLLEHLGAAPISTR